MNLRAAWITEVDITRERVGKGDCGEWRVNQDPQNTALRNRQFIGGKRQATAIHQRQRKCAPQKSIHGVMSPEPSPITSNTQATPVSINVSVNRQGITDNAISHGGESNADSWCPTALPQEHQTSERKQPAQ